MGEETNVQSPLKTSLGHLRAVKQLITVALDRKRRRVDPEAFQSIQLDISRIFHGSKETRVSCKIAKRFGHMVKWRALIEAIATLIK